MFLNGLMVFIGGGMGSAIRYLISVFFLKNSSNQVFPWHTFFANLVACLVFTLAILIFKQKINQSYGLMITTGFCGGLSTMSTFSFEVMRLLANHNYFMAFSYILLSLIFCFASFALIYKSL